MSKFTYSKSVDITFVEKFLQRKMKENNPFIDEKNLDNYLNKFKELTEEEWIHFMENQGQRFTKDLYEQKKYLDKLLGIKSEENPNGIKSISFKDAEKFENSRKKTTLIFSSLIPIISIFIFVYGYSFNKTDKNENMSYVECLVNTDWVWPDSSNPTSAWKFTEDGKFSFSTKMLGVGTAWGEWNIQNDNIYLYYERTTFETLPSDKVIRLSDCNNLIVESTNYIRKN